jgi:CBS domain-containing protein
MEIPSEWEEPETEETRVLQTAILHDPIWALDPSSPICAPPDTPLREAIELMNRRRIGAVLVTEGKHLLGIFTERDVLTKVVGREMDLDGTTIGELMTPDPETLGVDDPVVFALKTMHEGGFRHVPLLDTNNRPIAVISVKDVVEFAVRLFAKELLTAPPSAAHLAPGSSEGA